MSYDHIITQKVSVMISTSESHPRRHGEPRFTARSFPGHVVPLILSNDYFSLDRILSRTSVSVRIIRSAMYSISITSTANRCITLPNDNLTLLHIAAFCDALECFIVLVNHELSIQTMNAKGDLPIHYACLYGSLEVLTYILKREPSQLSAQGLLLVGASAHCSKVLEILFEYGMPDFEGLAPIEATLTNGDLDSLKILLAHSIRSRRQSSALLKSAVLKGAREQVEMLLEAGAAPVHFCRESPMAYACFLQRADLLRCLVDRAMDIDPPTDLRVKCAVHWMCESGSLEVAQVLMESGIDVSRLDDNGKSGASYLVDHAPQDVAVQILEMMANSGWGINLGNPTALGEYVAGIDPGVRPIEWLIRHGANLRGASAIRGKSIVEMIEKRAELAVIRAKFAAEIQHAKELES